MPRFALPRLLAGLLAILVTTAGTEPLRAQGPSFGGARTILPPARNAADRPTHVGIMGAVKEPGVYAAGRFPLLVDVVRDAGGLTDDATGNVRIVRNGRSGQQTFYTPNLDYRLLPGDLLVVDRYPPHRSRVRVNGDAAARDDGSVQLAFLGLVDRPVVLSMRRETATIARILRFLDQSPEMARSIRVVETGPHYTRGERTIDTRLAHGSVLLFDEARIDVARLPDLPAVKDGATPRPLPEESPAVTEAPSAMPPTIGSPTGPPAGLPHRDVAALPLGSRDAGVPTSNASLSTNPFAGTPLPLDDPTERPRLGGPSFDPTPGPSLGGPGPDGPTSPAIGPEVAAAPGVVDPGFLDGTPGEADDPSTSDDEATVLPVVPESGTDEDATRADGGSVFIVLGVLCLAAGLIWFLGRRPNPVTPESELLYDEHTLPAESTPMTFDRLESEPIASEPTRPATDFPEPTRPDPMPVRTVAAEAELITEEPVADEQSTADEYSKPATGFGSNEIVAAESILADALRAGEPVAEEPLPNVDRTWFRFDDEHERSQPSHTPAMGRSHLDELIEGEVQLAEEPVDLPTTMELYGRPNSERRYRLDAVEETGRARPRRPHFIARSKATARETVAANSKTANESNADDGDRQVRLLDRALNAVHGANRR